MRTHLLACILPAAINAKGENCAASGTAMEKACTRAAAGADLTAEELSCWQEQPQADRDGCSGANTTTCVKMGIECLTCPTGCQSTIGTMYADCDGVDGWEAIKVSTKASVQLTGCNGAATITLSSAALFASMYTGCKTLAL